MAAISKQRLSELLSRDDVVEGDADYWYGVVDGSVGSLWPQLFVFKHQADECAASLDGRVVLVAARILEDGEGDQIIPEN